MKTILTALVLVVVSVGSVYAGVSVPRVPEPSSLILLISGVGGLAFWLRKRR
jgi:PEP-CTERM motif-containing protein